MIGKKAAAVTKFREKVQTANGGHDSYCQFDSLLRDKDVNHGHTEVRWLSQGAMMKRFFVLREKIGQFMEKKGKPLLDCQSPEWMQDLVLWWILH